MTRANQPRAALLDCALSPMSMLFYQLNAASDHAARISAEQARKQEQESIRQAKCAETRSKQWATRKAKTGLVQEVLCRLPVRRESALSLAEVEALFVDFPHAPTGISSSLSELYKTGQIQRTGERRSYRYYNPPRKGQACPK